MIRAAVIGAGPAGMCAAITMAKNPQVEVTIYERESKIATKLAITGNGKCNLSSKVFDDTCYQGSVPVPDFDMPSFCQDELGFYTRTIHDGLYPYHESARGVVASFQKALEQNRVRVCLNARLLDFEKKPGGYRLSFPDQNADADIVIMAAGGMAGYTGVNGFDILKKHGILITDLHPSLVYLKTSPCYPRLKGTRVHGTVSLLEKKRLVAREKGEIMIKADGFGGICVMQLSRYYKPGQILRIDLVDELSQTELKKYFQTCDDPYQGLLTPKLARFFEEHGSMSELKAWTFKITGTGDFSAAQVTRGGVEAKELDDHFMLKKFPGMFVCGEMLDMDGKCGGYNLHAAFATGVKAGKEAVQWVSSKSNW